MPVMTWDSNDARIKWRQLLDQTGEADAIITRYGKPTAAVIDYEDYLALQEELDDLRAARRAMIAVEEWEKDPSTAKPLSEFKAELIAEGLLVLQRKVG